MSRVKRNRAPTMEFYGQLQLAYDFFNRGLFERRLPHVILTANRESKGMHAFFWCNAFRRGAKELHEIGINPDHMRDRTDRMVLSDLVHEMCHVEHWLEGRLEAHYHDKRFAELMERVGLITVAIRDGGRVGRDMEHTIKRNGGYALAYRELRDRGFKLTFASAPAFRKAAA